MPNFADGKIEVYVGPPDLGGADDLEAVVVEFIAGARRKLDIAVQELDSDPATFGAVARGHSHADQFILESELARGSGLPPL